MRPHDLVLLAMERAVCRLCAASATTVATTARLRQAECHGPALLAEPFVIAGLNVTVHEHAIMAVGMILFCAKCGAYSAGAKLVRLALVCRGTPANSVAKYRRGRLLDGRHPLSNEFLEGPRPLSVEAWEVACLGF